MIVQINSKLGFTTATASTTIAKGRWYFSLQGKWQVPRPTDSVTKYRGMYLCFIQTCWPVLLYRA